MLKGSLIIGQSGGPSPVINSSAYGVIRTALDAECITKVYGAYHGIKGVLDDQLLCMDEEDRAELDRLPYTPSSALGFCRDHLRLPLTPMEPQNRAKLFAALRVFYPDIPE